MDANLSLDLLEDYLAGKKKVDAVLPHRASLKMITEQLGRSVPFLHRNSPNTAKHAYYQRIVFLIWAIIYNQRISLFEFIKTILPILTEQCSRMLKTSC